ncbi:MAG TPA: hypothetical protein EYP39_09855 [Ghiorsea sp.]|nr:hypothetical protein [Ghiorsea sp.]HIP07333.1 hypothetical protein [Mariprofundaceae bacterium]
MKMFIVVLTMLVGLLSVTPLLAAEDDARFQIHVLQEGNKGLTVQEAMTLALPVLWQRVVPMQNLEKAKLLRGGTSLVLQFKRDSRGVNLVFNPVQVQAYLQRNNIVMIPESPYWNLQIDVHRFTESDVNMANDLINYSYSISEDFGFHLGSHGRSLKLGFSQLVDAYGEVQLQVDVQGAFSANILSETKQLPRGDLSYQLQSWVEKTLLEIRDAYSLDLIQFHDDTSSIYITVTSDLTLAAQVSLEQLLSRQPAVKAVIPMLLQKESKQYRVILKDADDSWVESWFASYGMAAVKQPQGSASQWMVE